MKFLCLFYFDEASFADVTPEEMRRLDDATIEHDNSLRERGHLLIASPLQEASTEQIIDQRRPVRLSETDGPFAESKEVLGGVVLLEARDMAEARALMSDTPINPYAKIRIRPLREADRHSKTGESRPDFGPA